MVLFLEDVADLSLLIEADRVLTMPVVSEHLLVSLITQMCTASKGRICSHVRAVFNPAYTPLHPFYPTIARLWEGLATSSLSTHCAELSAYSRRVTFGVYFTRFKFTYPKIV